MSNRKVVYLDDVIDAIRTFYYKDATYFRCNRAFDSDIDEVEMICTAIKSNCKEINNEIRRTGTIKTTTDQFHDMHQVCSVCCETQPWKEYPKFCSNCGVRFTNKECE